MGMAVFLVISEVTIPKEVSNTLDGILLLTCLWTCSWLMLGHSPLALTRQNIFGQVLNPLLVEKENKRKAQEQIPIAPNDCSLPGPFSCKGSVLSPAVRNTSSSTRKNWNSLGNSYLAFPPLHQSWYLALPAEGPQVGSIQYLGDFWWVTVSEHYLIWFLLPIDSPCSQRCCLQHLPRSWNGRALQLSRTSLEAGCSPTRRRCVFHVGPCCLIGGVMFPKGQKFLFLLPWILRQQIWLLILTTSVEGMRVLHLSSPPHNSPKQSHVLFQPVVSDHKYTSSVTAE